MIAAIIGGLTAQVGWLGLRVRGHPIVSLAMALINNDSNINIILVIIIIKSSKGK